LAFWLGKTKIGFNNQFRSFIYDFKIKHKKTQHMVQNYLDMVRVLGVTTDYNNLIALNGSIEEKKIAEKFFKHKKVAGLFVSTAESASKTRIWQDEKWAELADKLVEKNYEVVFVGSKNEKNKITKIIDLMTEPAENLAGEFFFTQTYELIKQMKLFISIDTGPLHIAAAQGVKTIGLFGPNTPTLWGPYGKKNISIYKNLNCSPCIINDKGCMPDCLRKKDRYACMRLISVGDVLEHI